MSKIKILFLSFILGLLVSIVPAFAQSANTSAAPTIAAMVNINNAKIVNQVGNNFNISFNISNGQGVQSNVKYGIRLVKKESKSQSVVDEKSYDESFTLAENSNVNKNLVYVAPEALSGTYFLFLTSFNDKGLPLGFAPLGQVKLTSVVKGLLVSTDTCSVTSVAEKTPQSILKAISFYPGDTISLSCSVTNQSNVTLSVLPLFETKDRSIYGSPAEDVVSQFNDRITFKPLEKKTITVLIPVARNAGFYNLSFKLEANGDFSNAVSMPYSIRGESSSIVNISPDADYYSKGENASIMVLWSGSAVTSAEATITTKWDRVCGQLVTSTLVKGKDTLVVPINKSCFNPNIKVVLKGVDGKILDEQTVNITTTSRTEEKGIFSGLKGALLIVIILLALAGLGIYLKRKGLNKSGTIVSILVIGLSLALVPFSKASAYTYVAGPNNDIYVTLALSHEVSSPNQVQGVYTPGEIIVVDGLIYSGSSVTNIVDMSAITIGNTSVGLFQDPLSLSPGNTAFGDTKTLVAPGCGAASCSYDVTFTTSVTETNPPITCSAALRFAGNFRWGRVIYIGPATHPSLTVTVTLVGNVDPGSTIGERTTQFTIPANSSHSFFNSGTMDCTTHSGDGCEIEGTGGFDHGYVSGSSSSFACGEQNQYYSTCFTADTQVTLSDGSKKDIQDVKIGDVLKGGTTNNTVLAFHRPELEGKVYSFNGGRYFVTEEHPFKTTAGWKSINPQKTATENIGITVTELKVGDTLVTDHGLVKLNSIDGKYEPKTTPLYNFKLDGDHTYYADGYLVHNKAQCDEVYSCSQNIPCIDDNFGGGYRATPPPPGICATGCWFPTGPQRPFCINPGGAARYCPTASGQCL